MSQHRLVTVGPVRTVEDVRRALTQLETSLNKLGDLLAADVPGQIDQLEKVDQDTAGQITEIDTQLAALAKTDKSLQKAIEDVSVANVKRSGNFLPLAGGTMTGPLVINDGVEPLDLKAGATGDPLKLRLLNHAGVLVAVLGFLVSTAAASDLTLENTLDGRLVLRVNGVDVVEVFDDKVFINRALTMAGTAGIETETLLTRASFGYKPGAGGTVTQATNKTTAVTLNKICGEITMNGAALGAGASVSFTMNNSKVLAGDVIVINHVGNGVGQYIIQANPSAGSVPIVVMNVTGGALSDALVLRFAVIRSVST